MTKKIYLETFKKCAGSVRVGLIRKQLNTNIDEACL